jgi:hypothetical protein
MSWQDRHHGIDFRHLSEYERWELLMAAADDLITAVSANTAAVEAVTELVENGSVPAADVESAVTQLNTNNAALEALVPAAPAPAPAPASS